MVNTQKIISSFNLQKTLNPKFWMKSGDDYKMRSEIRDNLLEITYDFIDSLNVDIVFSDIVMTGSLSNYNWSKYSDVDIHIIVNYNQFQKEIHELYDELFRMKKTLYGLKHDVTIYGYDVELFVENEDDNRDTKNVGRYSILYDEWIIKPTKENVKINRDSIEKKANQWMETIDDVLDNIENEDVDTAKKLIKKQVEKLRKYRQCGLDKGGEYSDENLVFKILRRNGYLEKIKTAKNNLIDKKFTIKEAPQNVNQSLYTNTKFKDRIVGNSTPSKDKINPSLLSDIDLAAKKAGVEVSITTAVSGHRPGSRHETGHAIDIAMVNGVGFRNQNDANKKGILDDINRFVGELVNLGYVKNSESGNDKAVLTFGFKGHDHHIHVSRKSDTINNNDLNKQSSPQVSNVTQQTTTKPTNKAIDTYAKRIIDKLFGGQQQS
jgi:hypothetical protein